MSIGPLYDAGFAAGRQSAQAEIERLKSDYEIQMRKCDAAQALVQEALDAAGSPGDVARFDDMPNTLSEWGWFDRARAALSNAQQSRSKPDV